ncbi:MAG: 50S ribosomal protein L30 [Acidobacteria bacterium]|nr:50S ribosomal protein L30 [Acidobacteriota bacterium]
MARAKTAAAKVAYVTVMQLKSPIGFNKSQGVVLRSLGLRRIRHSVTVQDTPSIRGMLRTVRHLVEVQE